MAGAQPFSAERWEVKPATMNLEGDTLRIGGPRGTKEIRSRADIANGPYGFKMRFRLKPGQDRTFNAWIRHEASDEELPLWSIGLVRNEVMVVHTRSEGKRVGVHNTGNQNQLPTDEDLLLEIVHDTNTATLRLVGVDSGKAIVDVSFEHDAVEGGAILMGARGGQAYEEEQTGFDLLELEVDGQAVPDSRINQLPAPHDLPALERVEVPGMKVLVFDNGDLELQETGTEQPYSRLEVQLAGERADTVSWDILSRDPLRMRGLYRFDPGMELTLLFDQTDLEGELRVRAELEHGREESSWIELELGMKNLEGLGTTGGTIAFTRRGIGAIDPPERERGVFEEAQTKARWGTYVFGWSKEGLIEDTLTGQLIPDPAVESQLYVPAVQVHNEKGGVFMAVHPRVACGFEWGLQGMRIVRNFYVPAGERIDSYDDGDGEVPFEFHLGLRRESSWVDLYDHHFYERYAELWPDLDETLDSYAMFSLHHTELTDELAERMVAAGGRGGMILHPNLFFTKDYNQNINHMDVELAHRHGLKLMLWGNTRMTTDSNTRAPGYDPAFSEMVFESSLTKDAQGRTRKNWSGFSANPSPSTEFGQQTLERIFSWIDTYDLDGYFLDIYDDSIDVDWGRSYGRYPFYPIQTATIEFVKELHAGIKERGKILILNAPHPSLMVHRYADAIATDTGHGTRAHTAFWYKLQAANRPFVLLGNPIGQSNFLEDAEGKNDGISHFEGLTRGLLYGAASPQHYWGAQTRRASMWYVPDPEQLTRVFHLNQPVSDHIAETRIIGGDAREFSKFTYQHADGTLYAALQNPGRELRTHEVSGATWIPEALEGDYVFVEWDLLNGPTVHETNDLNAFREQTWRHTLRPFDDVLLMLVPVEQKGEFGL